jgi:hypothetical protein
VTSVTEYPRDARQKAVERIRTCFLPGPIGKPRESRNHTTRHARRDIAMPVQSAEKLGKGVNHVAHFFLLL